MLAMKKALIFALLTLVAGTQVDGFAGSSQHFSPFSKNIIAKPKRHALAAPQLHKTGSLGASLPGTEVMAEVPVAQESQQNVAKEILAGIVVTLATVPTSISYSLVVGVSPVIGIWNSAICGLFAALIGGAPGNLVFKHIFKFM
ncbi:hypothetical protein EON65_01205 [archaeon]|nr:MAG: hypothetical protein EON65_01205 [archaeon]